MQIMLKCQDTTQIQYIYHCIKLSTGIQVHDMHAYNNHWALKKKKSDHKYLVEAQKVQCTTKHNYTINNFQQQKNILKSVYKITGD